MGDVADAIIHYTEGGYLLVELGRVIWVEQSKFLVQSTWITV